MCQLPLCTTDGQYACDRIADAMGVTVQLQNLGNAELCREITARIEHAFADRQGEWNVSIAGSRASENWDMRIEGPNRFERSYSLASPSGEHQPEAIGDLVRKLLPAAAQL